MRLIVAVILVMASSCKTSKIPDIDTSVENIITMWINPHIGIDDCVGLSVAPIIMYDDNGNVKNQWILHCNKIGGADLKPGFYYQALLSSRSPGQRDDNGNDISNYVLHKIIKTETKN